MDFILLDKADFPRLKPCAGWITPQVLRDLEIEPGDYPHGLTHFNSFQVSIKDFHFKLRTNQYAIRRIEFDNWLMGRIKSQPIKHTVESIKKENDRYVLDGEYSARYLVGAGGTHCPVKRTFFEDPGLTAKGRLIVALEEEFAYDYSDDRCHLWFLQNGLPGYAWYVPKANGIVNVGIGGSAAGLKAKEDYTKRHWNLLVEKLDNLKLIQGYDFKPIGHSYYLRGKSPVIRSGNVFLAGDALGLATRDMGEGIGPALRSGIYTAEAIVHNQEYSIGSIPRYSFPSLLGLRN